MPILLLIFPICLTPGPFLEKWTWVPRPQSRAWDMKGAGKKKSLVWKWIRLAKNTFLTVWTTSSLKLRFGKWDILSGNCHIDHIFFLGLYPKSPHRPHTCFEMNQHAWTSWPSWHLLHQCCSLTCGVAQFVAFRICSLEVSLFKIKRIFKFAVPNISEKYRNT